MFFRWKKADLVMDLMWDWKERVESRSTPRLRTSGDGEMVRRKPPTFLSRALGLVELNTLFACLDSELRVILLGIREVERAGTLDP